MQACCQRQLVASGHSGLPPGAAHPDGGVAVEELAEGRRTSGDGSPRMKDWERGRTGNHSSRWDGGGQRGGWRRNYYKG